MYRVVLADWFSACFFERLLANHAVPTAISVSALRANKLSLRITKPLGNGRVTNGKDATCF
jgi:hypothetical protein